MSETENNTPQRGFFARLGSGLGWLLKTLLKLVLVVAILGAIGAGGYYGYQEYLKLTGRLNTTTGDVGDLTTSLNNLQTTNEAQQSRLDAQATQIAELAGALEVLELESSADADALDAARLSLGALISDTQESLTALSTGLTAMQGDVITNTALLDQLNADLAAAAVTLDRLSDDLGTTNESVSATNDDLAAMREEYASPERELARMQQVLYLFRVWESIARARLYIAEGNFGLASADLETAISIVDALRLGSGETVGAALLGVRQRLQVSAENLTIDPQAATRDLETAWESLDQLLSLLIGDISTIVAPALDSSVPITITTPITTTQPITTTNP